MATAEHEVTYERVTPEEIMVQLDRLARDRLGMSGEEFLAQWRARALDAFSPAVSRIAVLARLLTD